MTKEHPWKFKLGTIAARTCDPFFMGKVKGYAEVGDKSAYFLEPMADVGQLVGPEREDSLTEATFMGDVVSSIAKMYGPVRGLDYTYSLHRTGNVGGLLINASSPTEAVVKAAVHLRPYFGVAGLYILVAPTTGLYLYYSEKAFYKLPTHIYDSLRTASSLRRENKYDNYYYKNECALYAKLHEDIDKLEKIV